MRIVFSLAVIIVFFHISNVANSKAESFAVNKITIITFDSIPDSNQFVLLDSLTDWLKINPKIYVEIIGHSDNIGSVDFKREAAKARADFVATRLIQNGIERKRIFLISQGDLFPLKNNATAEGRKANRRVEIKPVLRK